MILASYLDKEVRKFCEIKGIPISPKGAIPDKHKGEIEEFINNRLRADRNVNRRREQMNKMKIGTVLSNMLKGLKVESPIEEILRDAIIVEGLGKHLRTQFEIGNKRVDFAFPIAKLVVEADGKEYHRANITQLENDLQRDKYLARRGWKIIHIEGLAIRRNLKLCLDTIKEQLNPYITSI